MVRDHLLHAQSQHNRYDGEQSLGNGGHGQADGGHEHLARVVSVCHAGREHRRADEQAQQRELLSKVRHPALQRRLHAFLASQHARDGAQLRVHACGDHQALAAAIGDQAAGKGQVRAIPERKLSLPGDCVRALFHRLALPGQGAFIHPKAGRNRQPQVGGHIIARLQKHHVAHDQLRRGHGHNRPAAPHPGPGRGELFERLQRFFRPVFLNDAQKRVEQDHQQNDARVHPFAQQHAGHQGGRQENQHHHVFKLRQIHLPDGLFFSLPQRVGTVLLQPPGGLVGGETHGGVAAQRPRGLIHAFSVPFQIFHFLSGTGPLRERFVLAEP